MEKHFSEKNAKLRLPARNDVIQTPDKLHNNQIKMGA